MKLNARPIKSVILEIAPERFTLPDLLDLWPAEQSNSQLMVYREVRTLCREGLLCRDGKNGHGFFYRRTTRRTDPDRGRTKGEVMWQAWKRENGI